MHEISLISDPLTLEKESWDEGWGCNQLILFFTPQSSPSGEGARSICN
jgi:hypothetical protein